MMQDTDTLDVLLVVDGLKMLKSMCYKNLDMRAKDADEVELLNKFMNKANEVSTVVTETVNNNFIDQRKGGS